MCGSQRRGDSTVQIPGIVAQVPGQACYDPPMAFTRWDPVRDLLTLHEQIGQLVGTDAPGWTPAGGSDQTAGAFVLTAELPGLSRDHIEIHAEESRVVVRGERASGHVPCEQYHRVERGHGRFSRAFMLPNPSTSTR